MRYAPGVLLCAYASKTFPFGSTGLSSDSNSWVLSPLWRGLSARYQIALPTCLNRPSCLDDFVLLLPPEVLFASARVRAALSAACSSPSKVFVASGVQRSRKLMLPQGS